jgi:hypothetical protein
MVLYARKLRMNEALNNFFTEVYPKKFSKGRMWDTRIVFGNIHSSRTMNLDLLFLVNLSQNMFYFLFFIIIWTINCCNIMINS